jgi:hypothetical protein
MGKTNKKMGETLIISEELLKLYSPLSKNVDVDKIYPYLHLAQPYFVEPILGDALLTELQHQIDEDELTPENKALVLKVAPVLAYYATYLAMRSLSYSITEKGMTKEKSENSEPIGEKELGEYILSIKQQAEMYAEILIKYLCRCALLYPLWRPEEDCHCEKYNFTDGSAEVEKKFTVYFPNQKKGCDGCDRDIWIKKY